MSNWSTSTSQTTEPVTASIAAAPRQRGSLRLYEALDRVWECVALNALWLVASLPVVTAGSATIALVRLTADRRKGIYQPAARAFWEEFKKEPVARSVATVLILMALLGAALTLLFGLTAPDAIIATTMQAAGLLGLAAVLGGLVTSVPLKAQRDAGLVQTLRMAAAIGLGRPFTTVAAVALTFAIVGITILMPPLILLVGWVWARLLLGLSEAAVQRLTASGPPRERVS